MIKTKKKTQDAEEKIEIQNDEQVAALPAAPFFERYKRSEYGLISSVDYIFNEDGSIDWRRMIKNDFLYPNKGWFDMRKQSLPASVEGLKDNQLLIMLGGIKELAKLRGFSSVKYDVNHVGPNHVVAKCSITWIRNYELESCVTYEDVANATLNNTDDFCAKFLETIACNRAFVRCVRNFLNIHIVGADEIDKSKNSFSPPIESSGYESNSVPVTPVGILEKTLREKHGVTDFEGFRVILRELWVSEKYRFENVKDWKSFEDIPAKEARILLPLLSKK
jgi:hypothetical protein